MLKYSFLPNEEPFFPLFESTDIKFGYDIHTDRYKSNHLTKCVSINWRIKELDR